MNAIDQARSPLMARKIASLITLFREEFPDSTPDLSPWITDEFTQSTLDPNSIDVSFHFPGWHPTCRGQCVLIQVRCTEVPKKFPIGIMGIEAMGYSFETRQWRSSTIGGWEFEGICPPSFDAQEKLRHFYGQVFELFCSQMCSNNRMG